MTNAEDSPDLIYVLLPDGTTDPEEAVRKVIIPQFFSHCGLVLVPLDPVLFQDHVARRVLKQCKQQGTKAKAVDRAKGLYQLSGLTLDGKEFSHTVYIRPMWVNKNQSEQVH